MKMSKEGMDFLGSVEEYRTHPYDDQTGEDIEVWCPGATIGFGHLIDEDEWPTFSGRSISVQEADYIFRKDLAPFELAVMSAINQSFQLSDNKFDALVILTFNIGIRGFTDSSVVKMINNEHSITIYDDLEQAWMAWNKSQGKVMRGLINRRTAEYRIYAEGIYERW